MNFVTLSCVFYSYLLYFLITLANIYLSNIFIALLATENFYSVVFFAVVEVKEAGTLSCFYSLFGLAVCLSQKYLHIRWTKMQHFLAELQVCWWRIFASLMDLALNMYLLCKQNDMSRQKPFALWFSWSKTKKWCLY